MDKQALTQQDLHISAARNLRNLALAGVGTGLAGRGIYGFLNMLNRQAKQPEPTYPGALQVDVPYPVEEDEKEASDARTVMGLPWYLPAAVGTGAGSLYGGWKLMDTILDARRKGNQEQDQEKAQEEFRQALLSSYRQPKLASDEPTLGEELDRLYDAAMAKTAEMDKQAEDPSSEGSAWGEASGRAKGLYGTYALMSGLLGANWMYNRSSRREVATREPATAKREVRMDFSCRCWASIPILILMH